ncbi:mannosyltransferase putative-domain-containing protein [Polychytrium aggregatum]|uniref:mannosyltransferase putative-domain-containing protein n=1 Tax=Polychytrium aggregatum TaxID=110093 RepID=UPI0022FE69FD|nr:mannosyltransferase putative-domain-containing protein [Polychytrium aggregatum]KAI9203520.1 mannosyltransferase putative-domain-containing protein [Polychytrium aggregatum]
MAEFRESNTSLARNDLRGLAQRCRLFRDLFSTVYDARGRRHADASVRADGDARLHDVEAALGSLERTLFPFFRHDRRINSVPKLLQSFRDQRGIVISVGNTHYRFALHLVTTLREVLGCSLPIEMYYYGSGDLDADKIQTLRSIGGAGGISVIDISSRLGPVEVSGWFMKPFMILLSTFREVIFMDADALFLQEPSVLFQHKGYLQTGALFFRDRSMQFDAETGRYSSYVRNIIGEPSEYAMKGRIFRHLSIYEMDSGVVVLDKARTAHELLLICLMNTDYFNSDFITVFHGDKETFWVAFEAMGSPYYFNPPGGGALGYLEEGTGRICGSLYHPDEHMDPLWINSGIIPDKKTGESIPINLTHWATDTTWLPLSWGYGALTSCLCIKSAQPEIETGKLEGRYLERARGLTSVWLRLNENKTSAP